MCLIMCLGVSFSNFKNSMHFSDLKKKKSLEGFDVEGINVK